mgnify:FL=1
MKKSSKILYNNPVKSIPRDKLHRITEINPDAKVEFRNIQGLKLIKIYNFLKRPLELREFCTQFYSKDSHETLMDDIIEGRRSFSPGIQQSIDPLFFNEGISQYLHNKLEKYNLYRGLTKTEYYTNMFYPGMGSTEASKIPHLDTFMFAGNIYLSEIDDSVSGTNFYKCIFKDPFGEEEIFYDGYDLRASEYYDNYEAILRKNNENIEKADDFTFLDNDIYHKYHFEPAEFNSVSLYSGKYWHSVVYDAKLSKQYRYSLVSCFLPESYDDFM